MRARNTVRSAPPNESRSRFPSAHQARRSLTAPLSPAGRSRSPAALPAGAPSRSPRRRLARPIGCRHARTSRRSSTATSPSRPSASSTTWPSTRISPSSSERRSRDYRTDGTACATGSGRCADCRSVPRPPFEETVTDFERPARIVYRITKGSPMRGHVGVMTFSPTVGGGTHLALRHPPRIAGSRAGRDRACRAERSVTRKGSTPSSATRRASPRRCAGAAMGASRAPARACARSR